MNQTGAAREYIRIYNQPEHAIRVDEKGNISYDWSRFDKMAELILAKGNKLKVVFFGMPQEIALYPKSLHKRPFGAIVCISPPKDYKLWEELCADFARHVIKKYSINEVRKWTFRCWNEPDIGYWHNHDLPEYLKLYDYFAKGIKSVSADIKIGGPALSTTKTYREPDNFRFFLEHVTKGVNYATGEFGSPIDYIAVHSYGGHASEGGPGRKFPEVDYMIEQHIRYADMRDEYPELLNMPIHVEEWGVSAGGTVGIDQKPMADFRNSQYGAAFLTSWVERHIRMRYENDRKFESFTFCSSGYEKIPLHDFMGYRTLDTKNGFHKPILNAYKLLNRLPPELVKVNINNPNKYLSSFATRDEKKIAIIITNYQHDRINSDGHSYPVKLNIVTPWKPARKVTLNHWRIDQNHSNAYTVFKEIGSPELPNPLQIDEIKKRMDIELLEMPKQMIIKNLADIEFELPCNAVSLIEIIIN